MNPWPRDGGRPARAGTNHGAVKRVAGGYISAARGDEPSAVAELRANGYLPPHTRGCTDPREQQPRQVAVGPAGAGMNRAQSTAAEFDPGSPARAGMHPPDSTRPETRTWLPRGNGNQKRDPYGHVKRDPPGWRVSTSILLRRSEAGHGSPTAGNPPSPPPPIRTASRRFWPDAGDPWRPVRRRGRPGRLRPGRPAATRFEAGGTTQGHQRAPFLPAASAWFCFAAASLKLPPVVCSTVA